MDDKKFVDYYECLQLSPNADSDTIERVFRHFAKKCHPDNPEYSDSILFQQVVEAHKVLSDPEARAKYDVAHQKYWNSKWKLASEASDGSALALDKSARDRLLSLLYVQRRRDMKNPGMGEHEIARLLAIPFELAEFHVWYLKDKGWLVRMETGHLAITAAGVDQVDQNRLLLAPSRLIAAPAENETIILETDESMLYEE